MNLVEGSIVANRFRLNRLLGRGGMGSVWHATHLGLDIPCAVKFIEGEFAALPEAQARFEREAKAAAQLRSPHVVQILDHGISDGVPYIAMELLDGEDLGKRLMRAGKLSPAETSVVMGQVCRALTKAHSLGIVHRDLKPDNIFLVRDDDREIAKVLDFGIAKSNAHGIDGSNTKTGAMLGTPYYMSPEQAQGTKSVDYRSDLWSLAVIAFQCVTGRLPFESEALGDLLVKIIVSELPVPSHFGPVPPSFDAWWARAASRDPNQRFQSAKEFADALASVLGQGGATDIMSAGSLRAAIGGAMPGQTAQTPLPFGQTPPSAMAQSVAADGGMQGPHATTGAPIARTYSGLNEGLAAAPKKSNTGVIVAGALVAVAVLGVGGIALFRGGSSEPKADTKAAATQPAALPATTAAPPPEAPKPAEPAKTEAPAKSAEPAPTAAAVASAEPAPKKEPAPATTHHSRPATNTTASKPAAAPAPAKPKSDGKPDLGF